MKTDEKLILYFTSRYPKISKKKIKIYNLEEILDSFAMLDLILFIENEFKIKITNKDLSTNNFKDINNLQKLIDKKLK